MADNTKQQPSQDYIRDLLSPYIDGEVSDQERILVEQAVAASPELQQEFESLRQTVELVAALPPMAAPRPFTLSETDVQPATHDSKQLFRLPAWAGGLAMVAAALLCAVVAGGLFFGSQYSGQSASEIARLDQNIQATAQLQKEAAPAAEAPLAAEAEAPAEEMAAEEPMEEAIQEEAAEEGPAEESPADTIEEKVVVETEAEESQIDKETDDTTLLAGQAELEESDEAEPDTDQGAAVGAASEPTSTALPLPTMTMAPPPATPTLAATPAFESAGESALADAQEQTAPAPAESEGEAPPQPAPPESNEAPADSSAAEEESAKTEVPSAPSPGEDTAQGIEGQDEQEFVFRQEAAARPVEIREQILQVQPGFIQIQGIIDAEPGTVLVASLQRNQNPFDEWANAATIQGVVQPDGRFVFNIEASVGRTDRDLFAQEPAAYQIIIVSIDEESPITAVIQFDTSTPATAAAQATVTPTKSPPTVAPTNTPSPQPTVAPSSTPIPVQPTTPPQPAERLSQTVQWLLAGVGVFALLFVITIGIIAWLIITKKR